MNLIPLQVRKEFCTYAANLEIADFLEDKLKKYLLRGGGVELFETTLIALSIPSLTRRSIRWLAEVEADRKGLVQKYFKERMKGYYEHYQILGALDICKQFHEELEEDYVLNVLRRALRSNRVEVRRVAERYLKELGLRSPLTPLRPLRGWRRA